MTFYEKKIDGEIKYTGKIVTVRRDTVELQNGRQSTREVVEHPGGVAIVAMDQESYVYMVRQYRYPMERELLELPAGKLEVGEDPAECAIRELSEETGFRAEKMVYLGKLYPSPGYCQETLYLYLALGLVGGASHPDPDEFLSVERYPFDKLCDMVSEGRICDAKTSLGLLLTERLLKNPVTGE